MVLKSIFWAEYNAVRNIAIMMNGFFIDDINFKREKSKIDFPKFFIKINDFWFLT